MIKKIQYCGTNQSKSRRWRQSLKINRSSILDHPLLSSIVGGILVAVPSYWVQSQQHKLNLADRKWNVLTSYHTSLSNLSNCPRKLRDEFFKVANQVDRRGLALEIRQGLENAFSIFDQCEESLISARISLAGIGQTIEPLDSMKLILDSTRTKMNEIPAKMLENEEPNAPILLIVGPAFIELREKWSKDLIKLNDDTLESAKTILSEY
jgi:hypothetical protein